MKRSFSSTIIIYHEISNNTVDDRYVFCIDDIRSHLKLIKTKKILSLTCNELVQSILRNKMITNSIAITVDDGHRSGYSLLLPELLKYGLNATFFITTDWIGNIDFMNRYEIRYLSDHGMSIQSHAKTHNFLDVMSYNAIKNELLNSKLSLEDIVGKEVNFLSIPGGRFSREVIACAKEVGYSAIFTSTPFEFYFCDNLAIIGRLGLKRPVSHAFYNFLLAPSIFFVWKEYLKSKGKVILKKTVGGDIYYNLWKYWTKRKQS